MESFALVVFAVGHLLQLALVTTSPSLPYWKHVTSVHQEIPDFRKCECKTNAIEFGYHTGQQSNMPVKLAPSFYTADAKCLEQETVNAVKLESAAHGCVHVNVDM